MIVMEDFTKLSAGVQIPTDGRIALCPRCGRNGARRRRFDGSIRYVHAQSTQILGDGLRTDPADSCIFVAEGDRSGDAVNAEPLARPEARPTPGS